jgi:hypothetical protein
MGIFFIFGSTYSFSPDCYGENSSSAIAGQGLRRYILGGVVPLFASQLLVSQCAILILAIFGTLLAFITFVVFKCGDILRERSQLGSVGLGREKTVLHTISFV